MTHFQRTAWDIGGVIALVFAALTFLALLGLTTGTWLAPLTRFLQSWFGWGSLFIPFGSACLGNIFLRRRTDSPVRIPWGQVIKLELGVFASLALLSVLGGLSLQRAEAGLDGGRIGWGLAELLRIVIRPTWLLAVLLSVTAIALLVSGLRLWSPLVSISQKVGMKLKSIKIWKEPVEADETTGTLAPQTLTSQDAHVIGKKLPRLPVEFRKKLKIHLNDKVTENPPERDERLPSLDLLLTEQASRPDERNINLTAGLIEKTLAEFGLPAKVVGFRVGPTVTQFAVEPGFVEKANIDGDVARQKVRVSQISALGRDLALALSAERLRIEAPVPGRPYVGIEVPNSRPSLVRLRPILETEAFYRYGSPLTIALGRDVSGQAVVADLARMPHLLIAGTTGSGKSVCIAAMTTCLVMNNTPEDMRLVMADPKMVELVRFNGLPHLYGKVETELQRILGVLRWVVVEMDRRYKLLETTRSRNIDSYNRKVRRRKGEELLPHIVVFIDELADLMLHAPDQTEHTLVRLAQMARATGIHLVIATQRPSTDVVTGLIKANFPARISFAVASSIDSRVILDTVGAENLLGNGDMLFLPPEAGNPVRAQGVIVTDQEIEKVITFWQKSGLAGELQLPPWEQILTKEAARAEKDDLINQAIAIVRDSQRASASLLQRRLRIGYPRAARLIDELEDMGVIGPTQGGGREREVLIAKDDEQYNTPTRE